MFGFLFVRSRSAFYGWVAKIGLTVTSFASIAWLIMGSVFRWREEGEVCSESYLYKSGKFLKVYLILMYVVLGLFGCCGVLACCVIGPTNQRRNVVRRNETEGQIRA